jgi:hypothetical protein
MIDDHWVKIVTMIFRLASATVGERVKPQVRYGLFLATTPLDGYARTQSE